MAIIEKLLRKYILVVKEQESVCRMYCINYAMSSANAQSKQRDVAEK
jgi:hypothetical protein